MSIRAKVSSRYQIVIPKEVRDHWGLQPQDEILFLIDGDRVHMRPKPRSFTQTLRGLHAHVWPNDVEPWLQAERDTWT